MRLTTQCVLLSTNKPSSRSSFMASLTTIGSVMGSVALAGFFTNSTIDRSLISAAKPTHVAAAPTAKARVVQVTGEDFKFDAPDVIPAGVTEFRFTNKGPSLHHMAILKLADGKTIDDLRAVLANPGPPPVWVKTVGGPNAPDAGLESNANLKLEP